MKPLPHHPRPLCNPTRLTDWTLNSQNRFRTLPRYPGGGQGGGPPRLLKHPLSANYQSSSRNVGTLQTRSTNAANEITSVSGSWVTPTYDAAGNMVSAPKAGAETTRLWYVYDAWNRQVIVKNDSSGTPGSTLATYSYDGLNRRVTKVTTGEDAATFDDYFNENWQRLESRKNGDANPLDQFLWDLTYIDTPVLRWHDANTDGDLADLSSGNPGPTYDNTLYYTTDANHNVTALFDANQERVIERYVYDPYGKTFVYDRTWGAISESAVGNDVQWGGYVSDKETGNKLARERYYNVPLATWMARDFIGSADDQNLYGYASQSPINATDPFGLWKIARNGHVRATACKDLSTDTWQTLARLTGLSFTDWEKWVELGDRKGKAIAGPLPASPRHNEVYTVPNVMYFSVGADYSEHDNPAVQTKMREQMMRWFRKSMRSHIAFFSSKGFKVVSNPDMPAAAMDPNVHGILFSGHGNGNLEHQYYRQHGEQRRVGRIYPGVWTPGTELRVDQFRVHHLLGYLHLAGCNTWFGKWEQYVSENGKFIGYDYETPSGVIEDGVGNSGGPNKSKSTVGPSRPSSLIQNYESDPRAN